MPQNHIKWHQRVRNRVALAVLLSIIVPLVSFYVIADRITTRMQLRETEDDLETVVLNGSAMFSRCITVLASHLGPTAYDPDPGQLEERELQIYLFSLLDQEPLLDSVSYVTLEGRETTRISLYDIYLQEDLRDFSDSPALARVKQDAAFYGSPFIDEEKKPLMEIAVPVHGPQMEANGMIIADVSLRRLFEDVEVRTRMLKSLYIVDRKGRVIAHDDYSLVLRRVNLAHMEVVKQAFALAPNQPTPMMRYVDYEGREVLGLGVCDAELGWAVIAEIGVGDMQALGGVRQIRLYFGLVFLSAALLGGVGSFIIGSKSSQAIQRIQNASKAIGQGDFKRRVERRSRGELGELEQNLNQMAAKLEEYCHHLERDVETLNQMVYERTKSLQNAYDELQERDRVLKETQSALVQTEKLASLGGLVAGVVHEVNNPLAYVLNNVSVLQRDVLSLAEMLKVCRAASATVDKARCDSLLAQAAELAEKMDMDYTLSAIERLFASTGDGLQRIRKIVADLREFSRTGETAKEPANINEIVQTALRMLSYEVKKRRVYLETEFAELPQILCSPVKISQVLLNIVMNALQAVEEHGHVWVKTSRDGNLAVVSIRDDGHGIPPEIIDKVFDPFFTTRPRGEGTGLGLSVSYGIVREHDGAIEVRSTPGEGAEFIIKLPFKPEAKK